MKKDDFLKFKRIFSLLPVSERKLPVVSMGKKLYTWETINKEVNKKTVLAEKLLKELKKTGLL